MTGLNVLLGLGVLAVLCILGIGIAEGFMMFLGFVDGRRKDREEIEEEKQQLKEEIKRIEHH